MITIQTAGESHGQYLTGIINGIPSNLDFDFDFINGELKKRQAGYGRSQRMNIEEDRINVLSGIDGSKTTGNPISIILKNKGRNIPLNEIYSPRPGHGDLVGTLKYNLEGGRNILERASARETAMRVALGGVCKLLLKEFGIEIFSHVINIGGVSTKIDYYNGLSIDQLNTNSLYERPLRVVDQEAENKMMEKIQSAKKEGNSLGGSIELIVQNVPNGLGSHTNWNSKLDALLSFALMSIQGIKAIEIGLGREAANTSGKNMQDEIAYEESGFKRLSNNSGGIEAGISNGEDIVVRIHMKPIPTLRIPLETVDIRSKKKSKAISERSDVCAVPAAGIVGEAMVALVLANEFMRKFGGDSIEEITKNYKSYMNYLNAR